MSSSGARSLAGGNRTPPAAGRPSAEAWLPSLLSLAPLGVLLMDSDGVVVEHNQVFDSFFDLSAGEVAGLNVFQSAPLISCGLAAQARNCIASGEAAVDEGLCRTSAGFELYIRYYLTPINSDSGGRLLQALVVDLSSIKTAEEELRRMNGYFDAFVGAMSPLLTVDSDLNVVFANRSFEKEVSVIAAPQGQSIAAVLPVSPREIERIAAKVRESAAAPVDNAEFRTIDGRVFGYSIFRFRNEAGLILKDITRLKRLQKKVMSLHSRMLKLQESERQAVASELHDSVGQTILAAKLNLTAFERNREHSGDRFLAALELIDRASQELREIYTRLFPPALRDLGLPAALRSLAKNFLALKEIDAELRVELARKLAPELETTVFRIVQEIFNNIVKHSRASQVQLHLESNSRHIQLIVSDNGQGFLPEQARARSSGFGLHTLQRRVEDLDGEMRLYSAPGAGTTFEIEIPLRRET